MSGSTADVMAAQASTRAAARERRRALSQRGAAAVKGKNPSSPSGARMRGSSKSLSHARRDSWSSNENPGTDTNPSAYEAVVPAKQEAADPETTASTQSCGCNHSGTGSKTDSRGYRSLPDALAGLSGREAARAYREVLCREGRGSRLACRPTGRVRPKPKVPVKVEQGTTLSGTPVTGTQVERTPEVTGNEAGSCRPITGTEYVGSEQYDIFCGATPEPAPAKVEVGRTARGQDVTGVAMGRSVKVTGDEYGSCKNVTGTEYLSADKFESFCATKPLPPSAKVDVTITEGGQRVSGVNVGRAAKVTGGEEGSERRITGSQYHRADYRDGLIRNGSRVPHKVSVMRTLNDQIVTGTQPIPGDRVTGAESGECAKVTGTVTTGLEQYQACNRQPFSVPEKVQVMRTWHEQAVSGTSVERDPRVTGNEYGSCQPVTGDEYVGPDQYAEFCATDLQDASREVLSQNSGVSDVGVARMRGFSVPIPARLAREKAVGRITGTPYGAADPRITGPANLAPGLVSGTPESRYRDDSYGTLSNRSDTADLPRATGPR